MRRTYLCEADNNFYQMPKFLLDEEFIYLSNDARVIYMLLRNRHEISVKNKWYNENGEVYLYYKREDMQKILQLSENTITKAMKDLKICGLIEEERQGFGKPNRIYLLIAFDPALGIEAPDTITANIEVMDETQENQQYRKDYGTITADFEGQEPQNLRHYKNNNKENHNNVNQREDAPAPTYKAYGEYNQVRLAVDEMEKLVDKYGADKTAYYVKRLDLHIFRTAKYYPNHYNVIVSFINEDADSPKVVRADQPPANRNRYINFKQREWDYDEIEKLERLNTEAGLIGMATSKGNLTND